MSSKDSLTAFPSSSDGADVVMVSRVDLGFGYLVPLGLWVFEYSLKSMRVGFCSCFDPVICGGFGVSFCVQVPNHFGLLFLH